MASNSGDDQRLTVVIFGASGDLTRRKLAPALFHLYKTGALPQMCHFVGVARSQMDDESFRRALVEGAPDMLDDDRQAWDDFAGKISYISGSSTDDKSLKRIDKLRDYGH